MLTMMGENREDVGMADDEQQGPTMDQTINNNRPNQKLVSAEVSRGLHHGVTRRISTYCNACTLAEGLTGEFDSNHAEALSWT